MIWPIRSQMIRRNQFIAPSEYIMEKLTIIPKAGMTGTQGVRKGRGTPGWVRRMIQTATQTMTNAKSVPILVMWPTTERGRKAERGATKNRNRRFERHGVRNLGCTSEKIFGTSPSRDIEKNTRD